jgi:assimilatory nitrate reductase catalytic subunit
VSGPDAVATHCPYCALQCGIHLAGAPGEVVVQPNPGFPVNKGGLCVKGWAAGATLSHPDRLRHPLVRQSDGSFAPVTWDVAIETIARRVADVQARYGRDAVGVFGGGSLTNEKAYLLGKFARVALGTANIDYNGRFCMSSAAAAVTRALGVDRGLPFPLDDIPHASLILLIGANPAETMPPMMQYFEAQQRGGGRLIVVDPRRTATAAWASDHLRLTPGTDAALANGLLHIIIRDRLVDEAYVASRTENFEDAKRIAASYWPERVERITGISEGVLVRVAHDMARAPSLMVLTARGPEQQAQGVTNALAYINLALALGAVGRPAGGFGTITGQGNGQGGREHGQKADQLPGYRQLADPEARRYIASVWNVREPEIPQAGKSAFEMLDSAGTDIRALFIVASNPVVSAPDALRVARRLDALETLVVADFFLSETAARAHVVLPSAQWAEENGTTTNLEGRVIVRRRLTPPPDGVRTDIDILTALAAALGRGAWFPYTSEADVFAELRRATAGGPADYSGMTWEKIEQQDGVFWPCPAVDHPGTPRLFLDRFATASGRARFHATPHADIAEPRDQSFPYFLTTGRILSHYQSGTQTRRSPELCDLAADAVAEVHPVVAARVGIADNDPIVLTTRRGTATFRARLTRTIREDTIFVPFHWSGEQSANRLTHAALDPISRMPEFKVCAVQACRAPEESAR